MKILTFFPLLQNKKFGPQWFRPLIPIIKKMQIFTISQLHDAEMIFVGGRFGRRSRLVAVHFALY